MWLIMWGHFTPAAWLIAACALAGSIGCGDEAPPYAVTIDVAPILQALASEDPDQSSLAEQRLLAFGPAVLPALRRALDHEGPRVRRSIVDMLSSFDHPDVLPLLIDAAQNDQDTEVRYEAFISLGVLGDPRSRAALEQGVADAVPRIRLAATQGCGRVCTSPASIARLVDIAVRDPSLPSAIAGRNALQGMLRGSDPARRALARDAIVEHAIPRIMATVDRNERTRAALLASDIGEGSGTEALVEAVADAPPILRLQAIHALGSTGDLRALSALESTATEPTFGLYAYDAIRRMADRGIQEAVTALRRWPGAKPAGPLPPPPGAG